MRPRRRPPLWTTSDFSIAAYIHSRADETGTGLFSIRPGRGGYRTFAFRDADNLCSALAIEFFNSSVMRYDQSVRGLKKLVFDATRDHGSFDDDFDGWSTRDLSLAAFVHANCVELVGFRRLTSGRRQYELFFDGPATVCEKLSVNYLNSDELRFDQSQQALKRISR